MTTTSDYITDGPGRNPAVFGVSVRALDAGRTLGRFARRVTGAGLILAAAGLWLAPGSSWAAEILLIKLVLSLVAGGVGLALVQTGGAPDTPQVEIDLVRRRVRVVGRTGGKDVVLHDCSFADLGRVEKTSNTLVLWDAHGNLLAEVAPADRRALKALVSGLRDAGKL
tara:strand:+ start:130 stop:633 length:504 start_codon:yes stop_codon:yes gene_type:complete